MPDGPAALPNLAAEIGEALLALSDRLSWSSLNGALSIDPMVGQGGFALGDIAVRLGAGLRQKGGAWNQRIGASGHDDDQLDVQVDVRLAPTPLVTNAALADDREYYSEIPPFIVRGAKPDEIRFELGNGILIARLSQSPGPLRLPDLSFEPTNGTGEAFKLTATRSGFAKSLPVFRDLLARISAWAQKDASTQQVRVWKAIPSDSDIFSAVEIVLQTLEKLRRSASRDVSSPPDQRGNRDALLGHFSQLLLEEPEGRIAVRVDGNGNRRVVGRDYFSKIRVKLGIDESPQATRVSLIADPATFIASREKSADYLETLMQSSSFREQAEDALGSGSLDQLSSREPTVILMDHPRRRRDWCWFEWQIDDKPISVLARVAGKAEFSILGAAFTEAPPGLAPGEIERRQRQALMAALEQEEDEAALGVREAGDIIGPPVAVAGGNRLPIPPEWRGRPGIRIAALRLVQQLCKSMSYWPRG